VEVKSMKKLWLLCCVLILFTPTSPQSTTLEGFKYWSVESLSQAVPALSQQAAADPHRFAVKQLADFPNDAPLLVHREADGPPEWHETQVDVVVVRSGTATLIVGGTLLNGETVAPHEKRNGTIEGGVRQKVSAGDLIRIPQNTPHQFLLDGSKEFTYLVIKIKGY
jgi:mannose-6-phosphate isomerase-like protein (cupin superfamily)